MIDDSDYFTDDDVISIRKNNGYKWFIRGVTTISLIAIVCLSPSFEYILFKNLLKP